MKRMKRAALVAMVGMVLMVMTAQAGGVEGGFQFDPGATFAVVSFETTESCRLQAAVEPTSGTVRIRETEPKVYHVWLVAGLDELTTYTVKIGVVGGPVVANVDFSTLGLEDYARQQYPRVYDVETSEMVKEQMRYRAIQSRRNAGHYEMEEQRIRRAEISLRLERSLARDEVISLGKFVEAQQLLSEMGSEKGEEGSKK